eukprot:Phypoly_transcript_02241.p1 GENE.Phypoly_transcript_02241~~Phypoly_transcript_02241.p1  ORF type:complete len:888 (+),score=134.49 Phypoly_transcript_02241:1-2664(+)
MNCVTRAEAQNTSCAISYHIFFLSHVMSVNPRLSGEYPSNTSTGGSDGEPGDILQQLSESFQNFLFGSPTPTPKSPKASTDENPTNLHSSAQLSRPPSSDSANAISPNPSTSYVSSGNPPASAPVTSLPRSATTSPRNSTTMQFLQLDPKQPMDEETTKLRERALYETESLKRTLEEQLRQVDMKISANANAAPDDPISQIKMWFEMRTLKANLEKELKDVDQNIKRLTTNDPLADESPWDEFVSFLLPASSAPASATNSHNSSVNVSDNELSDTESKSKYAPNEVLPPTNGTFLPTPISFKPRTGIKAIVHVDCAAYYEAIAYAIDKATKDIFITCWFLTPELYLVRDPIPNPAYRLDWLLLKKAKEGVQVYVILWDETKIAVFKGSKRAQEMLEMHPNIHVIRHPPFTPIYWSHHQKLAVVDQELAFVGGVDLCFGRYDTTAHPLSDHQVHVEANTPPSHIHCVWPGKDYYNPTVAPMGDITRPFEDSVDRTVTPRMPWHDTMIQVDGEAARDVALNFISRWNHHREWNENQPFINWRIPDPAVEIAPSGTCVCQILRSLDEWSGAPAKEAGIYQAYVEAIEDADHYIYIENQNFSSSTAGGGVKNTIAVEIVKRIKRAIRKKETFRVYVMIPIAPDGKIAEQSFRSLMHWNYLTICRGGTSILEQLKQECPDVDPFDYISFYSLRTHGILAPDSTVVTEQIYVHSKLMIVDDRIVIIGSNNINDRSLLGDRDSELAIIVRDDTEKVNITMDGVPFVANKFAHDLRVRLFREYLGMKDTPAPEGDELDNLFKLDLVDPTAASFYKTWMAIAMGNTKIYEHVFPDIPRDTILTLDEYFSRPNKPKDLNLLEGVRGCLVLHPLLFLSKENLAPNIFEASILWDELFQ